MAGWKDPALPLYAADYLLDARVASLSDAEQGCLVRLWCVMWREGPIADEGLDIALRVARVNRKTFDLLRDRGFVALADDGRWLSPRMEAERVERQELRQQRSEAGRKGGKASARRRG